jgi:SAM-dependent methyltransferase
MLEDHVQRLRIAPSVWEHFKGFALSARAEDAVASRSCGDTILMLGPGSEGLLSRVHTRAGWRGFVYVADASWEVLNWTIERAQEAKLVSIDIRHARLASLPFRDREVDLVIAPLSLHHETALEPVVQEVARVLVPYGRFLLLDVVSADREQPRLPCGGGSLGGTALRRLLESVNLGPTSWTVLPGGWTGRGGRDFSLDLTFVESIKGPLDGSSGRT